MNVATSAGEPAAASRGCRAVFQMASVAFLLLGTAEDPELAGPRQSNPATILLSPPVSLEGSVSSLEFCRAGE